MVWLMASLDQGMLLLFQEQKGQRLAAGDWSTYSIGRCSSLKCCLERGFAVWRFSISLRSHFVPQSRRMRENFVNMKLAIPRRLSSTWGLHWSLPLAMRTREEINVGALACSRKLTECAAGPFLHVAKTWLFSFKGLKAAETRLQGNLAV